jgi:hypothetical protein
MAPIDDRQLPRLTSPDGRRLGRKESRKTAVAERALRDLQRWIDAGTVVPAAH